jgi:hypothetical protein
MKDTLIDFLFILNRYLHIVCTMVIVGGTLFFEWIVPVATGDLKPEQQQLVFGRARWSFRGLVWTCAILIVMTGIISSARRWHDYNIQQRYNEAMGRQQPQEPQTMATALRQPGWWFVAHASSGVIALFLAASLMTVRRPPDSPLYWMRVSLTILLIVIFMASVARHMRLSQYEAEHSLPRDKTNITE